MGSPASPGRPTSLIISLQKGGGSKDTWVLSDGPVNQVTLLPHRLHAGELSRAGHDLPSRIADDLFWLGRYVQRAASVARLVAVRVQPTRGSQHPGPPGAAQVLMDALVGRAGPWLRTAGGPAAARRRPPRTGRGPVLRFRPLGPARRGRSFHGLARVLRDRISSDAWRILDSLHRDLAGFTGTIDDDQSGVVLELLNRLVTGFLAFGGMAAESMTRGHAWRFLDLGVRVERGIAIARLVRSALAGPMVEPREEASLLDAVLEAADNSLTYRRRYLTQLEVPAVVDLLLADETNPRAVAFQAKAIEKHLSSLPRESNHPQRSPDLQLTVKLRTMLRLEDLSAACRPSQGRRGRLYALAADAIDALGAISELVGQIFFTHAAVSPRQLSPQQEKS